MQTLAAVSSSWLADLGLVLVAVFALCALLGAYISLRELGRPMREEERTAPVSSDERDRFPTHAPRG